ncbi:MAG: hypothetical protein C0190_04230 [Thermodesulfobacterium geofontis]|uniref:Uncharacterized protein n=1 Tax=Thermodesulfobacterium geofontis TaxID=1295609 RepID=A0A2N7QBB8_9BACT|nr:MAG: hypothetical protein C0190_04230 [Thermodesulfobacterium geofontis]PMP95727.1 MAG: hypothetical protein C0169_05175 [Thermodesulfobacterium geofontis]
MSKNNNQEEELPILCATCAWRGVCAKKFSFDSTKPIKCPDYTPDPELKKKKKELEGDKKED